MNDKELAEAEGFFEKFLLEHNPSKLIELQKNIKKVCMQRKKKMRINLRFKFKGYTFFLMLAQTQKLNWNNF